MPIEWKQLEEEVEAGLPNSRPTRDAARRCFDFHREDFEKYPVPRDLDDVETGAEPVYSAVLRRISDILCGMLYKASPQRVVTGDAVATEFLAEVYKREKMFAKWKRADALTFLGGFQAYQYGGGDELRSPVKITQWAPHELAVFTDPDDSLAVGAVVTLEEYDGGTRLKLWTREKVATYERKKGKDHVAKGDAGYKRISLKDNPYRRVVVRNEETGEEEEGVLPFTFCHWNFPCSFFDMSSPGDVIADVNEDVNRRLTDLSDAIRFQSRPMNFAVGVDPTWRPGKAKPGKWTIVPAGNVDVAGGGFQPTLLQLVPDVSHVAADWQELEARINHHLEMHGVPRSVVRMVQDSARSGVSIQAEQLPLIGWCEARRPDWTSYEEDAARMTLVIAEAHVRAHGAAGEAAKLKGMLDRFNLQVRWPRLYTMLPGPERDRSDEWRLQQGLADKVQILMERDDLTEEEAIEQLRKIHERKTAMAAAGIDPEPYQQPSPFGDDDRPQPEQIGEGPTQGQFA